MHPYHYWFVPISLLVCTHFTIGLHPEQVVVCTPPPPQARTLPSHSAPAVLPAERANFDSKLPHHPPKEIAYSNDNDSLQRDCPNQECEGP